MAVIGLGSNLLVADEGYDGVALRLEGRLAAIEIDGTHVRCGGGASLAAVVRRCTEAALAGIEFGCAIPGTVGGAVRMNAGAYGSEIRDVLRSADVVSAGGTRSGGPAELELSYRHSNVRGSEVVARAVLQLERGVRDEIRARVREMQRRRSESQPRKARTFGSVFKNPDEGPGAGALIEACGLKGHVIGGASISSVHANFIENAGGASSADVAALVSLARALRARALRRRSAARGRAARARHPGLTPPIWVAGGAAGAPKRGACSASQSSYAVAPPQRSLRRSSAPPPPARSSSAISGSRARARSSCAASPCGAVRRAIASPCVTPSLRAAAGRSLLALSPSRVAVQIEHVPTIRLASVDRDFPHTLRIHIVPERPVALAVGPGRYRSIVAASGRVLRAFLPGEAVPVLPHMWTQRERPIPGGSLHAAGALAALDALAARPPDFSAQVANVKIDPDRGIVMRLRGGLDIVLGPPLQLPEKLRAAAWVLRHYRTSAERAQLVYADVSAPERPAVMPRGGYAPTAGLGEHKKTKDNGSQTAQNGA